MKAQHTPGPWHTDNSKSFYVFAHGSMAEQAGVTNGPFVANCSTQANARLIAAAPDLLTALERIAAEPCDHGPGFCPREFALVAIAKMQGAP